MHAPKFPKSIGAGIISESGGDITGKYSGKGIASLRRRDEQVSLHLLAMLPCSFALRIRISKKTRDLFNDTPAISRLHIVGIRAKVGRCHYHSNGTPSVKNIDDESLVKVKIGIGKPVELRIRQPPRPGFDSPIIIFLRPGVPTATQNESFLKELALGAHATAVEIGYRLSTKDRYPIPIHTVLSGYDWVRKNLARGHTAYKGPMTATKPSNIGICGELAGGALATMLAVTECSSTPEDLEPQGISALAVGNPILDWTALIPRDPIPNISRAQFFRKGGGSPRGSDNECLTANGLCNIRDAFFSKAETYFDPFASPLLFFYSPRTELPDEANTSIKYSLLNSVPEYECPPVPPVMECRSPRQYPPAGSNLMLPWTKVEVGDDCILADQGAHLVKMMRRSSMNSGADRGTSAKNVKRDFEIVQRDGIGLWDEKHALEIGQWFGEKLRNP